VLASTLQEGRSQNMGPHGMHKQLFVLIGGTISITAITPPSFCLPMMSLSQSLSLSLSLAALFLYTCTYMYTSGDK
jgi:hypothetical protein